MKNWKHKAVPIFAVLLAAWLIPNSVQAQHWNNGWNHPTGNYYAQPVHYQPAIASPVVYHRPVVSRPIYSPQRIPSYTRTTKYAPRGRYARITRKTYTPYGTHEVKYRYDKKCGTWRVRHDFDD